MIKSIFKWCLQSIFIKVFLNDAFKCYTYSKCFKAWITAGEIGSFGKGSISWLSKTVQINEIEIEMRLRLEAWLKPGWNIYEKNATLLNISQQDLVSWQKIVKEQKEKDEGFGEEVAEETEVKEDKDEETEW